MLIIFWISSGLIIYHLIVYPVVAKQLIATRRSRRLPNIDPIKREDFLLGEVPSVTLIVPAHNEEAVIEAKVANIASLDYPPDRLSSVLYLDGCTDRTEAFALRALNSNANGNPIKVVTGTICQGKIAALNKQIQEADSEIVALSDASALLDPSALIRSVRWFADPKVGVVCPTYCPSAKSSAGERIYWEKQRRLKNIEAELAVPMGAHGAFYLFRRALWKPLVPETINDDFVLPMRIVQLGFSMIYDESVCSRELEVSTRQHEFRRRLRIGAGNLQQAIMLWRLADPRRPLLAFVFCSGKALRALLPLLVALAAVSSFLLALGGDVIHQGLVLAVTIVVLAGVALRRLLPGYRFPLFEAVNYFLEGLIGAFLGALLLIGRRQRNLWRMSSLRKEHRDEMG